MVTLQRTDSSNEDFRSLVAFLDAELRIRDGAEHTFYAQFNKIDLIQHVVVAYADGQAVGCGAFKPFADATVEIKRMFVLSDFRGRHIAQAVLQELEAWALEREANTFVLETGLKQPEAIRLYERCGYTRIPNYGQYIGVENSVCMQKVI